MEQMLIETFHGEPAPIPDSLYNGYPSFIQLSVMERRIAGQATVRRLLQSALSLLRACGSVGVHTVIHSSHTNLLAFYLRLGFEDIKDDKQSVEDLIVLGRKI